jgi:hypothetical protein
MQTRDAREAFRFLLRKPFESQFGPRALVATSLPFRISDALAGRDVAPIWESLALLKGLDFFFALLGDAR